MKTGERTHVISNGLVSVRKEKKKSTLYTPLFFGSPAATNFALFKVFSVATLAMPDFRCTTPPASTFYYDDREFDLINISLDRFSNEIYRSEIDRYSWCLRIKRLNST